MDIPNRIQFNEGMQYLKLFLKENGKTISDGVNYKLFTSGGLVLEFNLTIDSLISLLHIDIECLKEFGFITVENQIEQLNEMINNSNAIYDLLEYKTCVYNFFFDSGLMDKIHSLTSILNMKIGRIEFVSNYSPARAAINSGDNTIDGVDYYVTIRSIDNLIFMEFKRNESVIFKPVGMMVATTTEQKESILNQILNEQRVMVVSGVKYQNSKHDSNSLSEMYFKTERLLDIAKKHRAELNLTKDYFFAIKRAKKSDDKIVDFNYVVKLLTAAIINRTSFDLSILDKVQYNDALGELVNAYNKVVSRGLDKGHQIIKK